MCHPDFDTPENHLAREPFPEPEPDTSCPYCEGDGEPCEECGGTGVYVMPEPTDAEIRERARAVERALAEIESVGKGA